MVIARHGHMTADRARQRALSIFGEVAKGNDPFAQPAAAAEADKRSDLPTLAEAFETFMETGPDRAPSSEKLYRYELNRYLGDWFPRRLDEIARDDVEKRFRRISAENGWAAANRATSQLRAIYRGPCGDHEGLRNPVVLWLDGGGKFNKPRVREISDPKTVLPRWLEGIDTVVDDPVIRDAIFFALYTGMRRGEVLTLRWENIDTKDRSFRVEKTRTGEPLELPITRQLAEIIQHRHAGVENFPPHTRDWVFPSAPNPSGHLGPVTAIYPLISEVAGEEFGFQALRRCFIAVAEEEADVSASRLQRLANKAVGGAMFRRYTVKVSLDQVRKPAQEIADLIDELMHVRRDSPANDEVAPVRVA